MSRRNQIFLSALLLCLLLMLLYSKLSTRDAEEAIIPTSPPLVLQRNEIPVQLPHAVDNQGASAMLNESPIKIAAAHNYQVENEDAYDNQMGPYRVIAAGAGNARIINAKKEVVAKCAEGETFFDIAVSPSKKKIVAHTGSGRSKVYDFSAMKELEIPSNPPGENRFAFAEWRWLSEEVLMSFSGKQALDETGKPFTCCAGHTAEESELYIFSMVDQRLTKIELPGDSSVKVFALGRISNSGYFELLPTADHTNPEPKPVWFKFSLK